MASPAAEPLPPQLLAGGVHAHENDVLVAVLAGEENAIAPDHGRGAARPWHRQLPGDVAGVAPRRGQPSLVADAVVARTAPLGPVLRTRGHDHHAGQQNNDPMTSETQNVHCADTSI